MNHLQIAKNHLVEVEKNKEDWLIQEAAAVIQAHALIAIAEEQQMALPIIGKALVEIAEQLEIMNTSRAEILRKGYKMGKEAKK